MLQRIRQATEKENNKDDDNLLAGIVEIDETSRYQQRLIPDQQEKQSRPSDDHMG